MKNKLILLVMLLLFTGFSQAQWLPDVRLTNNPSSSFTSDRNERCIASSGDFVHVVWFDSRDGNAEIYYIRSTDGGISWGADTRLTNSFARSWFPSVSVYGSAVHVVWQDERDGNAETYYKRSADGGVNWGADTRLTNNIAYSAHPSISVSGLNVNIVWLDTRDGNEEIYYKRSTDGGVNWGADSRLTNNSAYSDHPSVSASGQVVHIVWFDERDGHYEIYYKRSTDGGISWGADTRLTNNSFWSLFPSVSVSAQVVHVVWNGIYYKRSTDGGVNWGPDTRLTNNIASSQYPSVSVSGSVVHVVWTDARDANDEIYYKRSTDGGIIWEADTRLTNNSAYSEASSVSVSGSAVHVVWCDNRDGNFEIYYKRDPTGNSIGINVISSEVPKDFSLSQNYPNPFNPVTKIKFAIPKSGEVKLVIYDILGREITTLVNEQLQPGTYEVDWDATSYSSGIYFYKLITESFTETKRMVLIK